MIIKPQKSLVINKPFFEFNDDQDLSSEDEDSDVEDTAFDQQLDDQARAKSFSMQNQGQFIHQYQSQLQTRQEKEKCSQNINNLTPSSRNGSSPRSKEKRQKKTIAKKAQNFLLTVSVQLFSNIFLVYPILILKSLFNLVKALITFPCRKVEFVRHIVNPIVVLVFACSVLNVCWETFLGFMRERDIYGIWFLDAFFLFFTKILIFSIIKLTKQNDFEFKLSNICSAFDPGSQNGLIFDLYKEQDDNYTIIDIPLKQEFWEREYLRITSEILQVDLQSQRFNTFQNNIKNPTSLQYIGFQFIKGLNKKLRVHAGQFLVLLAISLIKIICCVSYIFYHFQLGFSDLNYIITIALFNINEVYCLNVMLSNYDLRRKIVISEKMNSVIEHKGDHTDISKMLDLTSCDSLETWDNSRRVLYLFFRNMINRLEYSYCCIFLYYIFVANICLAAYSDIDLIIDEDSIFLNPLIVISSTFNFLFLNTLLLFRLYFGTKYNSTIEDTEDSIQNLIGIYQDLSQMYDYNFTKKNVSKKDYKTMTKIDEIRENNDNMSVRSSATESQWNQLTIQNSRNNSFHQQQAREEIEDQRQMSVQLMADYDYSTCYDTIISKIKYLSHYYVDKRVEFQGQIYQKHQEKQLQLKILDNLLKSLRRIKSQIESDSKQLSYQVFNVVKLDFQDSLFTIMIGLFTIIPEIIPKFIQQFKSKDLV